jgi:hypothetical protein
MAGNWAVAAALFAIRISGMVGNVFGPNGTFHHSPARSIRLLDQLN